MIASLPMYDWPETKKFNDLFWTRLAANLLPVCPTAPAALTRSDIHAQWQRTDLLLSQTCAYPLVTQLPTTTVLLGTPLYDVEHCSDGYYTSVVLVNKNDKRNHLAAFTNATLAYNGLDSQSGFNALKSLLVTKRLISRSKPVYFTHSLCSGAHRHSLAMVANGDADLCSIDPVSWALAQQFDCAAKQVRVLTLTDRAPALPLISSAAAIPPDLDHISWQTLVMRAFDQAIDQSAREHLKLCGITSIAMSEYKSLPISKLDMIAT